jgi:hypothetical protein
MPSSFLVARAIWLRQQIKGDFRVAQAREGKMSTPQQGPRGLADRLREGISGLPPSGEAYEQDHGGGHGASVTVRTATHRGHEIRIETTYRITIDGEEFAGPLEVLDNGAVHYHGLPQYAVPSAVELMKRVIDYFGTEPPAEDELGGDDGHDGHPTQHH